MALILFLKAHVRGYTRKDGTFVRPHDDKRAVARDDRTIDLFADPEPKAAPVIDTRSISAAADRLGLTFDEVLDIVRTPVDELKRRDRYQAPSNTTSPTTDYEKFPLGSAKIDYYGSDPAEAYVSVLREFDPNDLHPTERDDGIRQHETFDRYVQWWKDGHEAPPIDQVAEDDFGKLNVTNRRRVLTAQEAGVESIKGWFSPQGPDKRIPLKYGDVLREVAIGRIDDSKRGRDGVLAYDNPGGRWLKKHRESADAADQRGDHCNGPITAYTPDPVDLPISLLSTIKGARDEARTEGEPQYDRLMAEVTARGHFHRDAPILVGVGYDGVPYILEGNTRVAVARKLGIGSIPAEVRYFAGGERQDGPLDPLGLAAAIGGKPAPQFTWINVDGVDRWTMNDSDRVIHHTEDGVRNFWRWFGESRVLGGDGDAPKVMFHGSPRFEDDARDMGNIESFDPQWTIKNIKGRKAGIDQIGSWFSSESGNDGANKYAGDGVIYPVYLSIKRPYVTSFEGLARDILRVNGQHERAAGKTLRDLKLFEGGADPAGMRAWLKGQGYDGIRIKRGEGEFDNQDVWIALDPEQVKSAVGNDGSFDPKSAVLTKALQPGERWITVHPNGDDGKGQPILIQPQPDGSAKVIGGAGGSLNHMRLTGVKAAGEYADTIRERAKSRRAVKKAQRDRDKALGIHQAKADAHKQVTAKTREAQREYVADVAKVMGWDEADYKFDASRVQGQPDHVVEKMQQAHDAEMVKRADAAVKLNRERILSDAGARAEAEMGEVPLDSVEDDILSVQDLDPVREPSAGLGFSADYKNRAEAKGSSQEDIKAEAELFKKPRSDGAADAAVAAKETAQRVRENMELIRDPNQIEKLKPKLVEAKQALDLLKLEKKRKMAEKQAKAERKKIDDSVEEPKAYVLEIDDAKVDEKVAEDVANDLRTISTRAFLSEVAKTSQNPMADLGRHVGAGAYNSVNSLALAAGGAALVDRSVVDVLGIAGAAEVLARRLQSDLPAAEFKDAAEGMQEYHLHHYVEASREAIDQARELQAQAAEMELGEVDNGGDLAAMQEINRRRMDALGESQKVLGQALGEMEANAALVFALQRGKTDKPFQVSLGNVSAETAIQQVRALGLQRGDYTLETAAGNRVLKVLPKGLDRLSDPVNSADLEQVRRNQDIITGKADEDGWLPLGISDRPDLDLKLKPGVAPSLAQPFAPGGDLESDVQSYIGGRMADGDSPADIVSDLQSAEFFSRVGSGRAGAYRDVLDKLAPLANQDGSLRQVEALRGDFEKMADTFCEARGISKSPLHRQTFDADHNSVEALHRALASEPTGIAAYKQVGELTPQDQGALREYFAKHVARETPDAAGLRHELEAMPAHEPEKETTDMFGDSTTNPEWSDWKAKRDDLAAKVNASSMHWGKYVESMRGPEAAYAAMQDVVRSSVSKSFAETYNTLNPGKPLKIGRATIRENLNHLDAVDPVARDARLAKERELTDSLRERVQGRYASGGVRDKLDAAREEQAGLDAAQMGFFADEPAPATEKALGADERWTVGHEAERKIAEMMPVVGQNFKAGQPVNLFRPSMSGGKNWPRQRAIKMIVENKRAILSFGTGSGKTLIGIGAFTHLHQKGAAKRGMFLAPSIAQGNFGADALKFVEPGKFKWHCKPGASRQERIAAYKDPSNDFCVMTHQAFRDDMLHIGAQHAGVSEEEMSAKVAGMTRGERKEWARGLVRREGFTFPYMNVDEGHDLLDRQGKENSALSNVIDAFTDNADYYVNASADPIKNDVSEAFSVLQKMDPARYTDRPAFMRKYGVDTLAAKDSLRREMARFQYPSKIDPDITATRSEIKVGVSEGQTKAIADLDKHVAAARIARMQGKVDLASMKAISPSSFDGVPDDQQEAVARDLQTNLGILKSTAVRKVLDAHPDSGKADAVVRLARKHDGNQGVVFAHSLDAVHALRERLVREGYRVSTITGKDSAKEKARRIDEYNPAKGRGDVDIIVCSDAGATGANLQSGSWLANFDTPDTAKTHAQRNGRINRIGQKHDVDLVDLVSDHPDERRRRDRLEKKYALRDALTTPMESLDDTGVAHFLRQRQIARENGGLL